MPPLPHLGRQNAVNAAAFRALIRRWRSVARVNAYNLNQLQLFQILV
jgi:hypothetical protein